MSDDILDVPQTVKESPWKDRLLYFAVFCCIYWFISDYFNWPYSIIALATGCVLMIIHTIWSFITKAVKPLYSYGYFLGKLSLTCAVFLHLAKEPYSMYFVILAGTGFVLGIISLVVKDIIGK
jgi:hypothetical protein